MSEVATRTEHAISESGAVLSMIERIALDPNADIAKLEKMLDMQERVLDRNAREAFNSAMAAAQSQMSRVSADAENPQTRSRYASYAQLDRHLRPIYSANGFALSFDTAPDSPAEMVTVLCHVTHTQGYSRTYRVNMPADGRGAKGGAVMTATHASGAAMSYGMRYLLKLIFNVAVGEDDTDGNETARIETCTPEQAAELKQMIAALPEEKQQHVAMALADTYKVTSVEQLTPAAYESLRKRLAISLKESKA